MLLIVLQGFAVGLAYLAPIGMQNLFVINSALASSRRRALVTALVVALFDVSLTLSCFFGIGLAMDAVPGLSHVIQLVGGLLVIAIGIGLVLPKRAKDDGRVAESSPSPVIPATGGSMMSLRKLFITAFIVTWCNPQALIDGTMMLGAFRATFIGVDGIAFVVGACAASFVWLPGIALAVHALGSRFSDKVLRMINVVCGAVVILYGARLVATFFGLIA